MYIFAYSHLDLPRGVEWMIRGAYTPSLRVQTAPFGRCWYVYVFQLWMLLVNLCWTAEPLSARHPYGGMGPMNKGLGMVFLREMLPFVSEGRGSSDSSFTVKGVDFCLMFG